MLPTPAVTGSIVVIRNKKIMKRFKEAGAIGPDKAIHPQDAGLRNNFAIGRFVKLGMLARNGELLYIPESFTQTRRWRMLFGKNA